MRICIEFLSDWHVGDGSGRPSDVDRLVVRDARGVPLVPARGLLGAWRDAAEALAQALEASGHAGWRALVDAVFGSQPAIDRIASRAPIPGRLVVGPARIEGPVGEVLARVPVLREGLTFVVPSVAIDPDTGAAAEEQLSFTEVVRTGAILHAEARLEVPGERRGAIEPFLAAALEGICALGARRRRGRGRCRCRIVGHDDATAAFFSSVSAAPELAIAPLADVTGAPGPAVVGDWRAWQLPIQAQQPILIHERTLGNVMCSLDHLPGAVLLPELARRLRGVDVFGALATGALLVRSALPEIGGGRGLPVPACWHADRYSGEISTRLEGPEARPGQQHKQLRPERHGYVPEVPSGVLEPVKIERILCTHNALDDEDQRPTSEIGGVFTYQAIAPGARFVASVVARGAVAEEIERVLRGLGGKDVSVGRSRRAGYGAVQIGEPIPAALPRPTARDRELVLWLCAPLLVRGPTLLPTTSGDAVAELLRERLGVSVQLDTARSWLRTVRLESWQSRWGLPRPSLVGLAPGSLLTFTLGAPVGADRLAELARDGLGERRAEGMGEIVVNPGWLEAPPDRLEAPPERLCSQGLDVAQEVVPTPEDLRLLRAEPFGRRVLIAAARRQISRAVIRTPPPRRLHDEVRRTALGALRTQVVSATGAEILERFRSWLAWEGGAAREIVERLPEDDGLWHVLHELPGWVGSDPELRRLLGPEALQALLIHWCRGVPDGA